MTQERLLIYGGSGQVASTSIKLLKNSFEVVTPTHSDVDVTQPSLVRKNIEDVKPDLILYSTGFTSIDLSPEKPDDAWNLNSKGVSYVAEAAVKKSIPVYYLSTEVVFDGKQSDRPYREDDLPNPLSLCGKTKRGGEKATLEASPKNGVIRLIICYSPFYARKLDLARLTLKKLEANESITTTTDQIINPIFVDNLAKAIVTILSQHAQGIYHVGATDFTTPYKFATRIAEKFRLDPSLIKPSTFAEFSKTRPEPRPQYEWLDTAKFRQDFGEGILQTNEESLDLFIEQYKKLNNLE